MRQEGLEEFAQRLLVRAAHGRRTAGNFGRLVGRRAPRHVKHKQPVACASAGGAPAAPWRAEQAARFARARALTGRAVLVQLVRASRALGGGRLWRWRAARVAVALDRPPSGLEQPGLARCTCTP